jgi:hypothetical protein
MKLNILILVGAAAALYACWKQEWMGFVYPNKADLTQHIEIGVFSSLEECRGAAQGKLVLSGWASSGDYECGLSCEQKAEYGDLLVCKETSR